MNLGIFLRPNVEGLGVILEKLRGLGATLFFEKINAYGLEGVEIEEIGQKCEIVLSLGGDGTLISTLHKLDSLPILGVNAGNLGFLTGIALQELIAFFPSLLNQDYTIAKHAMLSVYLDGEKIAKAINEVLISKASLPTMTQIEARINQKSFNYYHCDGLIVATPTGSTAYNISAGGSVIYPYCKNILLTPLAPHSLTQRPMVLGDDVVLEFCVKQQSQIIIDGQQCLDFFPHQRLKICFEGKNAKLIYPKERDFFAVLREKFHWGE